eukprot:3498322-Rhodomonas_salina.1
MAARLLPTRLCCIRKCSTASINSSTAPVHGSVASANGSAQGRARHRSPARLRAPPHRLRP